MVSQAKLKWVPYAVHILQQIDAIKLFYSQLRKIT